MILREPELELRAAGKAQRPIENEHRLPRHVAAAGPDVIGPGRFVLAVDGKADWPGNPFAIGLVVEDGLQRRFGWIDVGRGADDLHPFKARRAVAGRRLDARIRSGRTSP